MARSDVGHHVGHTQPVLLHAQFDGLDRVRRGDRVVLCLIGLHQGSDHLEALAFGRVGRGVEILDVGPLHPVSHGDDQPVVIPFDIEDDTELAITSGVASKTHIHNLLHRLIDRKPVTPVML
jgi:hypothetical protein